MPLSEGNARPGIIVELADFPPTPERLIDLVELLGGECGYRAVALDWGASFPWSTDGRFAGRDALPESVVAGLDRVGGRARLLQLFPGPGELPFVRRISAYRPFFTEAGRLDLGSPGARKLYLDLLDDFLDLLGASADFAVKLEGEGEPEAALGVLASRLDERSLSFSAVLRDPGGSGQLVASPLRSREGPRLPLLRFRPGSGLGAVIESSVEAALLEAIERARASFAVDPASAARLEIERRAAAERDGIARELEGDLADAWDAVRRLRELVARSELGAPCPDGAEALSRERDRLDGALRRARRQSERLAGVCRGILSANALDEALSARVLPLEEELHLLDPRVRVATRRGAPPSGG